MTVQCETENKEGIQIATITLDHGELNILDLDHCHELVSCLKEIRADDRVRVVIIRGAGKAFSAGVDISQHTPEKMPELLPAFHEVFHELLKLRAFTVAAVHGFCLGGGAELAFACDRVIASEDSKISLPEVTLGCYPPIAIPLLPQRLPHGKAIEMLISGKEMAIEELAQWGAIDRVAPAGKLEHAIQQEIDLYQGKSPAILGMIADLVHGELRLGWASRIEAMEKSYLEKLLPHPDVEEGIQAFLQKRLPNWQDPDERPDPLETFA